MGLSLDFRHGGCGVGDSVVINMSKDCKWENAIEREKHITKIFEIINNIMVDAKITDIMDLKDKPVEIYINGMCLVGWRLLKEVL
jgi:hypothetical protein